MTYFAVVYRGDRMVVGYVLDAYPSERLRYLAELAGEREQVIGEYAELADAQKALAPAMMPTVGGIQ